MTDLMFLLLLFLLIATTLINPNALKLMLPRSNNVLKDKAVTTISIQHDGSRYNYYVELNQVDGLDGVEVALKRELDGVERPLVSLHCDKSVAIDEVVQVMSLCRRNEYELILATAPN